jgi:hypothetical protein
MTHPNMGSTAAARILAHVQELPRQWLTAYSDVEPVPITGRWDIVYSLEGECVAESSAAAVHAIKTGAWRKDPCTGNVYDIGATLSECMNRVLDSLLTAGPKAMNIIDALIPDVDGDYGSRKGYEVLNCLSKKVHDRSATFTPRAPWTLSAKADEHLAKVKALGEKEDYVTSLPKDNDRDVGTLNPVTPGSLVRYPVRDWVIVDPIQDRDHDDGRYDVVPKGAPSSAEVCKFVRRRDGFTYLVDNPKPGDWLVSRKGYRQLLDCMTDQAATATALLMAAKDSLDTRVRRYLAREPPVDDHGEEKKLKHGDLVEIKSATFDKRYVAHFSRTLAIETRTMLISLDTSTNGSVASIAYDYDGADRVLIHDCASDADFFNLWVSPYISAKAFMLICPNAPVAALAIRGDDNRH